MGKEKIKRPGLFPNGLTANELITASSALTVDRTITASSDITVTGKGTFNGGSYGAVQTNATTGGTLAAYGMSILSATAATAVVLPAPVAGVFKAIFKTANSTAISTVTTAATSQTYDGTNTVLTLNGINQHVQLQGASSTRWLILGSTATYGALA